MAYLELLTQTPWLWLIIVFIFSLLIGSFLNVVIYRWPLMLFRDWRKQCYTFLELDNPQANKDEAPFNLCRPASTCQHCHQPIKAIDNIPIVSFLCLKGKCRHCQHAIGWRYPCVELCCAILSVIVAWHFSVSLAALCALIFTWGLLALSFIDIDHQILPDDINLTLLWLGILINYFGIFTTLESAIIGAIAGYMSLWIIMQLFKLITGKEGMGHGDFKLFALIGAWCGWQVLPLVILIASILGAIIGIIYLRCQGESRHTPIPFGPYLALAGWIALLWGTQLTDFYLIFAGLKT